MNAFRSMALTLVACAATVSVTACTAGLTTASSNATGPAATSASSASSARPATSASTVAVSGGLGSFPVPAGAKIAENVAANNEIIIFFSGIAPAKVSAFYATALPRAGYTVSGNSVINVSGVNEVAIQFTGHGYKGMIAALANFPHSSVSIAGLGHKNVTNITLLPQ
jgi:ABC-type phosphate transport system substrate-binding protein